VSEVGQNGLEMTTCKCRENTKNLVMTREWFTERIEANIIHGRQEAVKEILELLEVHRALWFSQSLAIGSGAFWSNKAATTQTLINEIRKRNNV
jgi:hypothetical protein